MGDDKRGAGRVLVWSPDRPGSAPAQLDYRHVGRVNAIALLADGRVVTFGANWQTLVWDPARPDVQSQLSMTSGQVAAVAVLADGRVATRDDTGLLKVWDPGSPGTAPSELGHHRGEAKAMAALADGRLATGGENGQVWIWDPNNPVIPPPRSSDFQTRLKIEMERPRPEILGLHEHPVTAVAVLADGRVVSGGYDRQVQIWDPNRPRVPVGQVSCSVITLATAPPGPFGSDLVIAHEGGGLSLWSAK